MTSKFHLKWLTLLILLPNLVIGNKFHGYFSTNTYTFSRQNSDDSTLVHTRLYQSIWLQGRDLLINKSRLNVSGVFYTDPVNSFDNEPVFQIYNFNYSISEFNRKMNLIIGRQFQYAVSDAGRMDGLTANYQLNKFHLKGFAGSYVPASGITDHPGDDHFFGGELSWKKSNLLNLKVGYSDKSHSRSIYQSYVVAKKVEVPPSIYRRIGFQSQMKMGRMALFVRSRHKISKFELNDLTIQTTYQGDRNKKLQNIRVEYNLRQPRIPDNSIFSVFNSYASQEISMRGRFLLNKKFSGWFNVREVLFNNDQSSSILFGVGSKTDRIELVHQSGYGGSSNRAIFGVRRSIGKLDLSSRLSLGNYRLIEGKLTDLSTITFSSSYPVWKKIVINSEIHVLKNKYYKNDTRFQFGMRYRL